MTDCEQMKLAALGGCVMTPVIIDYTNWRGKRRQRKISPLRINFSATEHHPEKQWLLVAVDVEKEDVRTFAMSNIHSWRSDDALPISAG